MRTRNKKKLSYIFMLLAVLNLFVACGSNNNDDDSSQNEQTPEEQTDQGTYQAQLTPLNVSAGGTPSGTATIKISGDEVVIDVGLKDAQSTVHAQHIYTGASCPPAANDVNLDGFVDYQESKPSVGQILIPLDNDLKSQAAGGLFPSGSAYSYEEKTSLTQMLADLMMPDPNPADDIAKLSSGDKLNLEGRVVVIHGVSNSTSLPATVAGAGTISAQKILPIACGKLIRVAEGEPVPVPVPVPVPTPTPDCPPQSAFNTRLSSTLLISGVPCRGGETTESPNHDGTTTIQTCRAGQWLVTVDNENVCTPDGGCTEIFVFPIVTSLMRASNSNPPDQCTYNMRPLSPANQADRRDMGKNQVRFYFDRDPQVIPKSFGTGAL